MRVSRTRTGSAGRGVSELTGLVLLLGIVVAGAMLVFVSGSAVTQSIQETNEIQSAEMAMSEVDGQLGSIAMAESNDGNELRLGSMSATDSRIVESGEIVMRVNDSSACEASIPLTALEYEHESGTTIAYEAGAVWRSDENGGVTELSSPGVHYRDETLQLSLVNLSGTVADSTLSVRKNTSRSVEVSRRVDRNLFSGTCGNPDYLSNVTLTVTSTYHEAWRTHLEREFGASHVTRVGAESIHVEIPRSMLPPELDNSENQVVDLTDADPTTGVVNNTATSDDDTVFLDKGVGNEYEATVELLGAANGNVTDVPIETNTPGDPVRGWNNSTETLRGDGQVQLVDQSPVYEERTYWNNWTEGVPTNETLEIVFVIDESGSMGDGSKMGDAQDAAHDFVTTVSEAVNGSAPRFSVVGYTANGACGDYYRTVYEGRERWICDQPEGGVDVVEHHPLNTDHEGAHEAIEDLEPQGNTPISQSIEEASNILEAEGNDSNEQFIVLLTDGFHNVDNSSGTVRWPDEAAAEEVPDGVTLHAVGLGSEENRDDAVLQNTAGATDGGQYFPVEDSEDLGDTFADIAHNVTHETVEHNESYTETELVDIEETSRTVDASNTVDPASALDDQFDANLTTTRTLTEAESRNLSVGDDVWVNGTDSVTIDENRTVDLSFEVQRFDESNNQTYTTTVTRSVDLNYQSTVSREVNDSVTLQNRHLDSNLTYEHYLLHPRASMAVDVSGTTETLWDGRNLNNLTAPGVSLDGFETGAFTVSDGDTVDFQPRFDRCTANESTGTNVTIGGTDYEQTYCTGWGSQITGPNDEVHVYPNDTTISTDSNLAWQRTLQDMLDTPSGQYYRMEGGDMVTDLPCDNYAVVVVEGVDNGTQTDANNLVFLTSVGRCAEEVRMNYVVGVDVSMVSTDNESRVSAVPRFTPAPAPTSASVTTGDSTLAVTQTAGARPALRSRTA